MDLLGDQQNPDGTVTNALMTRRAMARHFPPVCLQQWLARSERRSYRGNLVDYGELDYLLEQAKFRVLEVNTGNVVVLNSVQRYVALSYVWGNTAPVIQPAVFPGDTATNGVAWKLDMAKLPRTIRDAAMLTRQIGERYLWVDQLCIDQTDSEDKAAVVSEMNAIYSTACLTIIAADDGDVDAGLLRLTGTNAPEEHPLSFIHNGRKLKFMHPKPTFDSILSATKWATRGWTYQEYVLSKRCVFFTNGEVFFSSNGVLNREAYTLKQDRCRYLQEVPPGNPVKVHDILSSGISELSHLVYNQAVMTYTRRALTYERDRLSAFSGILRSLVRGPLNRRMVALSGLISIVDSNAGGRVVRFVQWLLWQPSHATEGGTGHRIKHDKLCLRALLSWS